MQPSGAPYSLAEDEANKNAITKDEEVVDTDNEWQYQLPSPPSAFRDSSPTGITPCDTTNSISDFRSESIVSNPELFEKLEMVKDKLESEVGDNSSSHSCEDAPVLSTVTLASLEKRKQLVYNRELSTSLKFAQVNSSDVDTSHKSNGNLVIKQTESKVAIQKPKRSTLTRYESYMERPQRPLSETLPNFQISAYDSKQNINIFEDDSVRSSINRNTRQSQEPAPMKRKTYFGVSMENIAFNQNEEDVFKKPGNYSRYKSKQLSYANDKRKSDSLGRSESFSLNENYLHTPWKPQNRVQRSKSQSTINLYKEKNNAKPEDDGVLSKTNSLFDVSGLQSLEVSVYYKMLPIITLVQKDRNFIRHQTSYYIFGSW